MGCSQNAADVTQDTFVRLLSLRDTLYSIHNPRGFLATTARRLIIDRVRRDIIEQSYLAEMSALGKEETMQASPEHIWQAIQALDDICRVLQKVPARARSVFLLHYLDGKTQQTIADQLQVTARTIRNDLALVLVRCQRFTEY